MRVSPLSVVTYSCASSRIPSICPGLATTLRPVTLSVIRFVCLYCLSRSFTRFLFRSVFRCISIGLLSGLGWVRFRVVWLVVASRAGARW